MLARPQRLGEAGRVGGGVGALGLGFGLGLRLGLGSGLRVRLALACSCRLGKTRSRPASSSSIAASSPEVRAVCSTSRHSSQPACSAPEKKRSSACERSAVQTCGTSDTAQLVSSHTSLSSTPAGPCSPMWSRACRAIVNQSTDGAAVAGAPVSVLLDAISAGCN